MSINIQNLRAVLAKTFTGDQIELIDTVGDNNHYEVRIVSQKFTDLTKIQRHQLVYQALGNLMDNDLHAISIHAISPEKIR